MLTELQIMDGKGVARSTRGDETKGDVRGWKVVSTSGQRQEYRNKAPAMTQKRRMTEAEVIERARQVAKAQGRAGLGKKKFLRGRGKKGSSQSRCIGRS